MKLMNKLPSKWTATTFASVIATIVMLALQAANITSIPESTVTQIIMFVIALSGIGGAVKVGKIKASKEERDELKRITRDNETLEQKLHRLEFDQLEKIKNKLGLATSEPTSRIIEELQRFSSKSKATLIAVGLTSNDFHALGLDIPEAL